LRGFWSSPSVTSYNICRFNPSFTFIELQVNETFRNYFMVQNLMEYDTV
jgi:hypothetical protein